MPRNDQTMKEQLLNTVKELLAKDIDLKETPALFHWQYEEYPEIEFQMLITGDPTYSRNHHGQTAH